MQSARLKQKTSNRLFFAKLTDAQQHCVRYTDFRLNRTINAESKDINSFTFLMAVTFSRN
jgi:hypothetical protein